MLQHDAGWVAVLDGDRYVGVLTPATLHEALRRSVGSDMQRASTPTPSTSRPSPRSDRDPSAAAASWFASGAGGGHLVVGR